MSSFEADLYRLADLAGIRPSYRDVWDVDRNVATETLQFLLAAMGFAAGDEQELARSLAAAEDSDWVRMVAPAVTLPAERAQVVPVVLPVEAAAPLAWRITVENGDPIEGTENIAELGIVTARGEKVRRLLPIRNELPMGYHRLELTLGTDHQEALLIVAPARCYLPPALGGDDFGIEAEGGGRVWGLAVQLYSLRSARNWGIGDLTDLRELSVGSAAKGARVMGLNPLHALFPAEPRHISPYSPSSRRFLNPLYLDIEAVPDFAQCSAAQERFRSPEFTAKLDAARTAELVEHQLVSAAKSEILELLWESFRATHLGEDPTQATTDRGTSFLRYRAEGGTALAQLTLFQVLHERFGTEQFCWPSWPEPYRNPRSPEVASLAQEHADRIAYYAYLQWETDRQLADVAMLASGAGMSVGLYRDLAVGVDLNGAEAWSDQDLLLNGATIGAPPDLLNQKGQNWGLVATDPLALKARAFAPFIAALQANMRHSGALRIDHAMSLLQLYVIPAGATAAQGAYLRYPVEDLLAIVALESHRNRCAVVGEALGTVPDGFTDRLDQAQILSYRLLVFERLKDGTFLPPEAYPPLAAASAGTHDIATLKGFWLGRDIEWRRKLSLYPTEDADRAEVAGREEERRRLLDALVEQGVLPAELADELLPEAASPVYKFELVEAVHRYLGQSPARLMLIQLEDALQATEMINLPGTVSEHPNWRRKLSLPVDALLDDAMFHRLIEAVEAVRPSAGPAAA